MDVPSNSHLETISGDFKFKYVAEEELLRIVRKVRRERQRERDALLWRKYVEDREKCVKVQPPVSSENHSLEDNKAVNPTCSSCNCQIDNPVDPPKCDSVKKPEEALFTPKNSPLADQKMSLSLPPKQLVHTDNYFSSREGRSLQRVAVLRYRIGLALDSIFGMIQCQPTEPDGPDDLERRRTRTNEFLSRFSRNYLFQLRIQVAELRRQIVCSSLETPGRHTEHQALMQKFVSAHQTAVQSLQAYLTQLPSSLHFHSIFGKLQDLLCYLCDLSSLKNQLESHAIILEGFSDVGNKDEIDEKCRELINLLEEKKVDLDDATHSARASSPQSTRGSMSLRAQQHSKTHGTQGNSRQGAWKRSAAHLARQKFGPPSSIRSGVSPRLSSRGHLSNDGKSQRNNTEIRELLLHMHDVLCNNKIEKSFKKKRRSKHKCSPHKCPSQCCKRPLRISKPLTEVQNLSSNVQLVITRHPDSDSEEHCDVATDTDDLNFGLQSGGSKKNKKVGWAETGINFTKCTECPILADIKQGTESESPRDLSDKGSCGHQTSEKRVQSYRESFQAYKKQLQNPSLQKWCDSILDSVFQDVAKELEPSFLLEKMYHLEFKD